MALSQRKLQNKRHQKEIRRRQKITPTLTKKNRQWTGVENAPVVDALVPTKIFDLGIGNVWLSRKLPNGLIAVGGFLVDVYCLGIKDTIRKTVDPDEYGLLLAAIRQSSEETYETKAPAYIRKLVEQAAAYAQSLGFDPRPDYDKTKAIFGNLLADECGDVFAFGSNGKPYYVCGPNDSPAFQNRVVKTLEASCGPDGYEYMTRLPGIFDDDDDFSFDDDEDCEHDNA